jgi:hypothetical protein
MPSLNRHILAGPEHDRLTFHADCPRCRDLCAGSSAPNLLVPTRVTISVLAAAALGGLGAPATSIAAAGVTVKPVTVENAGTPDPTDGPAEPDDPDVDTSDQAPDPSLADGAPTPDTPTAADTIPTPTTTAPLSAATDPAEPPVPAAAGPTMQPEAPHGPAAAAPASNAAAPPTPASSAGPSVAPPPTTPQSVTPAPAEPTIASPATSQPTALAVTADSAPTPSPPSPPTGTRPHHPPTATPKRTLHGGEAIGASSRASTESAKTRVTRSTSEQPSCRTLRTVAGNHHVIAAGECLWSISRARLGAQASIASVARYVDALWDVNATRLATSDPDVIPVGAVIILPSTS